MMMLDKEQIKRLHKNIHLPLLMNIMFLLYIAT
jgi:hypothetical protein